jgi:glycosyltransferase involved in cell wall biosynthesis
LQLQSNRISAIIPLYNGAVYIKEALQSVLDQERPADEIIVVDDGSTDNGAGADIVREMAKSFPITLLTKPNGGQASSRNYGVAHSSGTLIALLDQDDAWYPHHLRELEHPFLKCNSRPLGWAYSNLDEMRDDGIILNYSVLDLIPFVEHPKKSLLRCISNDLFILPGASMISRAAFEAVGGFDEQFVGYEDDDLFLRIFMAGYPNVYINEPLTKWRMHAASTSFTEKMAASRARYFSKLIKTFPDDVKTMRFYTRDHIAPRFVNTALEGLRLAVTRHDQARTKQSYQEILLYSQALVSSKRWRIRLVAFLLTFRPMQMLYRAIPKVIMGKIRTFLPT